MAAEKAKAAINKYKVQADVDPSAIFMASDTSVVIEGEILGKPSSLDDSRSMLRRLSGRSHQVITSLCLCDLEFNQVVTKCIINDVLFRDISDVEIERYWKNR